MTDHLTDMYQAEAEKGMRETPPGMAYWKGTGPKGMRCRQCEYYVSGPRYIASSKSHAEGQLMPGSCHKYTILTHGLKGAKFPTETPACKYFEPAEDPPRFIVKP